MAGELALVAQSLHEPLEASLWRPLPRHPLTLHPRLGEREGLSL